ncbi:MAG: glycosyltransferase family 4 protein [Chloroflexi bacterium]|nr:glycosyltransferase family 4 protein [Chloroflexota bacterium]
MNNIQKVLFAHQSTIPHYRVPFYNALERLRPQSWYFDVVYDHAELDSPLFFQEPLNFNYIQFPLVDVNTLSWRVAGKRISYQTFWRKAAAYDLVIVENALNNLAYPLSQLHQVMGTKVAYWGHGWDHSVVDGSLLKTLSEKVKLLLARKADGFFAYTSGVETFLKQKGLSPHCIFVVNNTIDINKQRCLFEKWREKRTTIRERFHLEDKKTLLFVGRLTQNKRIDFMLEAFSVLTNKSPEYHLLLVGSGSEGYHIKNRPNVTRLGSIIDPDKLAEIYVASDLFTFPGSVGLGPLQALCYDLPVVTVDSPVQMPEIEYLNQENSILLPMTTSPEQYAHSILQLFDNQEQYRTIRSSIWPSIRHLTIEQMAQNFIQGINAILAL